MMNPVIPRVLAMNWKMSTIASKAHGAVGRSEPEQAHRNGRDSRKQRGEKEADHRSLFSEPLEIAGARPTPANAATSGIVARYDICLGVNSQKYAAT